MSPCITAHKPSEGIVSTASVPDHGAAVVVSAPCRQILTLAVASDPAQI